jgi:hypothetical protein
VQFQVPHRRDARFGDRAELRLDKIPIIAQGGLAKSVRGAAAEGRLN